MYILYSVCVHYNYVYSHIYEEATSSCPKYTLSNRKNVNKVAWILQVLFSYRVSSRQMAAQSRSRRTSGRRDEGTQKFFCSSWDTHLLHFWTLTTVPDASWPHSCSLADAQAGGGGAALPENSDAWCARRPRRWSRPATGRGSGFQLTCLLRPCPVRGRWSARALVVCFALRPKVRENVAEGYCSAK
jgi:hypothetical protein